MRAIYGRLAITPMAERYTLRCLSQIVAEEEAKYRMRRDVPVVVSLEPKTGGALAFFCT